jgi:hypothetical protein
MVNGDPVEPAERRVDPSQVVSLDPDLARSYAAGSGEVSADYRFDPSELYPVGAEETRYYAEQAQRAQRAQREWHKSPQFQAAHNNSNWLTRAAIAVLIVTVISAIVTIVLRFSWTISLTVTFCGIILAGGLQGLAAHTMISARAAYVPDTDPGASDIRRPPGPPSPWLTDPDLQSLIVLNRTQMQIYHKLATDQAKYAARNSRRAMIVGFLLLIVGGVVALRATDATSKAVVGALAGIGSLLSGYIGRTFLRAEDRAMDQLNYYFQQPLVTSYMLAAERLTLKLTETKRDNVLTTVVNQVLAAAHASEQVNSSSSKRVARSSPRARTSSARVAGNSQSDTHAASKPS